MEFLKRLGRKKVIEAELKSGEKTKLSRCLTTFDLTALGVGSTIGLGLYVLSGTVAAKYSGPAVVVSWIIAGVASTLSGLCYAEFGGKVPTAGSAYVYSYVSVGEFVAFVIGWNMILEYVIGTAGVAKGYSKFLNYITGNKIENYLLKHVPLNIPKFSHYVDFLSFGLSAVVTVLLSIGVKESTMFNNVCTSFNLLVVAFVIICGAFKADFSNWNISKASIPHDVPREGGNGGFAPFGFAGIMAGAAKCFFGFVGFDIVATTGEEVKNPQKAIPRAFVSSLIIIFCCYLGVAVIQTLMQPYYLQDNGYALPFVFQLSGYSVARWIITIGALAGLSISILGAMFPLPRVIYAIANDGLIFRWLGKVNERTKTPLIATIISGFLSGFMAAMFDLDALIDMMSIGTLMAYILVCVSVLIIRYKLDDKDASSNSFFTLKDYLEQSFNRNRLKQPTDLSSQYSAKLILAMGILSIPTALVPGLYLEHLKAGDAWAISIFAISAFFFISSIVSLKLQPQHKSTVTFQVPFVPLVPCLGIFINVYLMFSLSGETWERFGVWMAVGLVMYFAYGIFNSNEEYKRKGLQPPGENRNNDKNGKNQTLNIPEKSPEDEELPSILMKTKL